MIAVLSKSRALVLLAVAGAALGFASKSYAVSNSFVAVLNETNTNNPTSASVPGNFWSDSKRSVVFYDAADLGAGPLFAVMVPFENGAGTGTQWEEPQSLTVNPATGDMYIMAFDSNGLNPADQWSVDTNETETTADDDTNGDLDIYKINFQTVLNHWKTNYEGQTVTSIAGPLAVGNVPTVTFGNPMPTAGVTTDEAKDYVTYGVVTPWASKAMVNANHTTPSGPTNGVFDADHPNTFQLGDMVVPDGAIEKIGEVSRSRYLGTPSNFHAQLVTFIDEETLFMIDDASQTKSSANVVTNDFVYRMVERVSTSAGAAVEPASPSGVDGGFNRTTTESWESRQIARMRLDDEQATSTLSEPISTAYAASGAVRGVWVVDRDQTALSCTGCTGMTLDTGDNGDDLAFLQLDSNNDPLGYRAFVGGATKFNMSNDPAAGSPDGQGHIGKVFIDSDTGELIVVEEGFGDTTPSEPAVIRATVNYDSGGQIALTWGPRVSLLPGAKDPNDINPVTTNNSTPFERGYFSAYDSVSNTLYFAAQGPLQTAVSDVQIHNMLDMYSLDLDTGVTTTFMNVDDRFFPFFATNPEGRDSVAAFTLVEGLDGDFNDDGYVDGLDYTVWRNNFGDANEDNINNNGDGGDIGETDFDLWKLSYGTGTPPGAGGGGSAVPEPASVAMLMLGLVGFAVRRRR